MPFSLNLLLHDLICSEVFLLISVKSLKNKVLYGSKYRRNGVLSAPSFWLYQSRYSSQLYLSAGISGQQMFCKSDSYYLLDILFDILIV